MRKKDEIDRMRTGMLQLRNDLILMLPKRSDTMSAMRQREMTEFTVRELNRILGIKSVGGPRSTEYVYDKETT